MQDFLRATAELSTHTSVLKGNPATQAATETVWYVGWSIEAWDKSPAPVLCRSTNRSIHSTHPHGEHRDLRTGFKKASGITPDPDGHRPQHPYVCLPYDAPPRMLAVRMLAVQCPSSTSAPPSGLGSSTAANAGAPRLASRPP